MSVTINTFQTIPSQPDGRKLAEVTTNGDIIIYPQGLGHGPSITMTEDDWRRIVKEVRLAFVRQQAQGDF